ncbi:MAG: Gfo/Idh/MocA family oxidoreductase [Candidatus Omnitrophica bacterium]|nr:Gfo/Idh/MocA family oxidoreductase [Candidatus Omnitrophota bacterium]
MQKINLVLIGCGHLGARHLKTFQALRPKVNITAVCDIDPEKGKPLARQYHVPYYQNYRELLGKAEAVSICTPTITHAAIAQFFLEHQIHTFIEKPISYTLEEADILIDSADRNRVKLQVGHVERFNSAFVAIAPLAANPLFVECHRLNLFPNRSLDIGVVMDLMIHDIDIILGLVRSSVKDIQAVGINVLTDKEDIANARLSFTNGCVCNITASRISPEVTRKIRMFIQNAYISLDYAKQEAFIYTKDSHGIHRKSLPIEKEEPLQKELEHFIDCIREDKKPLVSGVEAREALKVALEITHKIWEHKKSILSS